MLLFLLACSAACYKVEQAGFSEFLNNHAINIPAPPILPLLGGSVILQTPATQNYPPYMDITIDADMALSFILGDNNAISVDYFDATTNSQLSQKGFAKPPEANRFGKIMQVFTDPVGLANMAQSINPPLQKILIRFDCSKAHDVMFNVRTLRNHGYVTPIGKPVFYSPPWISREAWNNMLNNLEVALDKGCRKVLQAGFKQKTNL